MRVSWRTSFLLAFAAVVEMAAGARAGVWEFQPGFNIETRFDSNVGRISGRSDRDFVYILSPRLESRYESDRFDLDFAMETRRFGYARFSKGDAWSFFANGFAEYSLTPQTRFFVRERFARTKNLPGVDLIGLNQLDSGFERILANTITTGIRHQWSPQLSFDASVGNLIRDTDLRNGLDTTSFFGSLSSQYVLTPRNFVGTGVTIRYDSSEANQNVEKQLCRPLLLELLCINQANFVTRIQQRTQTYNVFLRWTHVFSENSSFSLQGGPAVIRTFSGTLPEPILQPNLGQVSCRLEIPNPDPDLAPLIRPTNCRFDHRTSVTFFANASVQHSWKTVTVSAGYDRTQSPPQSTIGSSIEDSVTADASWQFGRFWTLTAGFRWTRRETEATQRNFDQYATNWRVTRRLSKFVSLAGFYRFFHQERAAGPSVSTVDSDGATLNDHIVGVLFRWELDPVRL